MGKAKMETTVEANSYRLFLQDELRREPEIRGEWQRANEALKNAEELVRNGDKSPPYLSRFQAEVSRLAKRLNAVDNEHTALLMNTCQNQVLRDELHIAREIRSNLRREWTRADLEFRASQKRLSAIADEVRAKLGPGAVLPAGCELPWQREGFLATVLKFGKKVAADGENLWAVRGETELHFSPGASGAIHESDIENFAQRWREASRQIRLAEAARTSVSERSNRADVEYTRSRQAMIDSPI